MDSKRTLSFAQEMILTQKNKPICPHCNTGTGICDASCSALEIDDRMKMKYCANEDYDACPIFLVKKLQRR